MTDQDDILELLKEAVDGIIECRKCGNSIEPDCPKCSCGWKNPVVYGGMI
jgi:hypothetical protein